jgi:Skp family chaperone for outer membrane proteins
MKSMKLLVLSLFLAVASTSFAASGLHAPAVSKSDVTRSLPGGGGGDDKEKKEKGGRKEKDESTKDAKTNDASTKPSQHARASAKAAKYSAKFTQQQIMGRAKVRLFFHNMFNTKYGKPVNFRNTRARNRWSKGHRW